MWKVAGPATISTSCSAGRSSSETESPGERADDVDEQARRQDDGAVADDVALERDAEADLHVGRAQLDGAGLGGELDARERLDGAARGGGAGDGLELREQRGAGSRDLHVEEVIKSGSPS